VLIETEVLERVPIRYVPLGGTRIKAPVNINAKCILNLYPGDTPNIISIMLVVSLVLRLRKGDVLLSMEDSEIDSALRLRMDSYWRNEPYMVYG